MLKKDSPSVIVITPTTGRPELKYAIESVASQTFSNLTHLIVIDGNQYHSRANKILEDCRTDGRRTVIALPDNTGENQFYGHRIYAACSYLINADYVFFLDEDNWFDINHVESLLNIISEQNLDWAYSLRKICDHENQFVTNDDCESLGKWPSYSGMPNLVDTSCYCVKRDVLTQVGHNWFYQYAADRHFYKHLSNDFSNFNTTALYTLNYVLQKGHHPNSQYFLDGNDIIKKKYGGILPWHTIPPTPYMLDKSDQIVL